MVNDPNKIVAFDSIVDLKKLTNISLTEPCIQESPVNQNSNALLSNCSSKTNSALQNFFSSFGSSDSNYPEYSEPSYFPNMQVETSKNETQYDTICQVYDEETLYELSIIPCMFLVSSKYLDSRENGQDYVAGKIDRLKHNQKTHRKLIANLVLKDVTEYDDRYTATAVYLDKSGNRQSKMVVISLKACQKSCIVSELNAQDIFSFETGFSRKKISDYIYELLRRKAAKGYPLPHNTGWYTVNNRYIFVSAESCKYEHIPADVKESFDTHLHTNPSETVSSFIEIWKHSENPLVFTVINAIRICGILTTPMREIGILMNSIFVVQDNPEIISLFTQVYDREISFDSPVPINIKSDQFLCEWEDKKDCAAVFVDNNNATKQMKNHGIENTHLIHDVFRQMNHDDYSQNLLYPSVVMIITSRLSQEIPPNERISIDLRTLSVNGYKEKDVQKFLYDFDKLIVRDLMGDPIKVKELYRKYYESWIGRADFSNEATNEAFAALGTAYQAMVHVLNDYVAEFPVTQYEFEKYLSGILSISEKTDDKSAVVKEFSEILNHSISSNEYGYYLNSPLTSDIISDCDKPVIFYNEENKAVLINDDIMDSITEKMHLADSSCIMRKHLNSENLLLKNDDLKLKVTLYDQIKHNASVTAVSEKILTDESRSMIKGNFANYIQCTDNKTIERICVGKDKLGKDVYWSTGHEDLTSKHLLLLGSTGCGKTFAMNLIVKQLFDKGHNIVYVNFKHRNFKDDLASHGLGREFSENYVDYHEIGAGLSCTDILSKFSNKEYRKMIAFTASGYSNEVEELLTKLYEYVSNNDELDIVLVIDEVHCLKCENTSPLYKIMSMGRGVGISLISAFQSPGQICKKQEKLLYQSAVKMIFRMDHDDDLEKVARMTGKKPYCQFKAHIKKLHKQSFIMTGFLEDSNGELYGDRFIQAATPYIAATEI
ncbi:MAG: AAA family ATPase [Porcipelethomonas sp.]